MVSILTYHIRYRKLSLKQKFIPTFMLSQHPNPNGLLHASKVLFYTLLHILVK